MAPIEMIQAIEIEQLRNRLAATEVQRDALAVACRALLTYRPFVGDCGQTIAEHVAITKQAQAALALTPEHAASIVEERDRLRAALKELADRSNWATSRNTKPRWAAYELTPGDHPAEFARQALAGTTIADQSSQD